MQRVALTDLAIKRFPLPEQGTKTYWDATQRGLGLRVGAGGARTFVCLIQSGRTPAIGRYPTISLADARKLVREMLAEKTLGRTRPDRLAFDDAKARYLAECERKNRESTRRSYKRHLAAHYPFGRTNLSDIQPRDILKRLNQIEGTSERHHAFVVGKLFFSWCVRQSLLPSSPMQTMATPRNGTARERVLSDDELKALWKATEGPYSAFKSIVRLLILTGQRRGEIGRLEWDWIDQEKQTITFPSSVTKNGKIHTIPYGELTRQSISEIERIGTGSFCFPAARERTAHTTVFAGWSKAKNQLDRESGVTAWTLHDLRRTYATTLQRLGIRLEVTEALLNHISGSRAGVAGIYQRYGWQGEMREAVLKFEAWLSSLVSS